MALPIDSQIRARVERSTEELAGVIRQTALDAVGAALGLGDGSAAQPAGRRKEAGRRRRGGTDVSDAVLAHVRSNPGSRAEEIAAALGANGEDVKRALQGLKAAGAVKARGKARGTNYNTAGATRKAGKKKASRKKKGARRKTSSVDATA